MAKNKRYERVSDVAVAIMGRGKWSMKDYEILTRWFKLRREKGLSTLDEDTMERIIEDFEMQCSNRFQDALKTEKGLGIEYDEDVICDVCRSKLDLGLIISNFIPFLNEKSLPVCQLGEQYNHNRNELR
ncbi:hypothetical protein AVEN_205289-1 [Araneus ventricosus]|uniref:Uncharacterized protein n=1 Tax=Araneus ventricosus TaxID=182803 RepID=A0A4Y2L4C7_ARAVE|nr:hypothetical protein AVEN_205289-1 [Araneus ventricosus]